MKNLMFDLETLGREPGCGITEIGWCCFSDEKNEVSKSFGHLIPIEQSLLHGFATDPATVRWWLEEQKGFPDLTPAMKHITFPQVLSAVAVEWNELWFAGVQTLWAKPALFDIPVLNAAYDLLATERPIILRPENFWRWKCLSTLKGLPRHNPNWEDTLAEEIERVTAHRAQQDAENQAHDAAFILSVHAQTLYRSRNFNSLAETNTRVGKELTAAYATLNKLSKKAKGKGRGRK